MMFRSFSGMLLNEIRIQNLSVRIIPGMTRASGQAEWMNGFLLCLLSPVWRAKLCGEFGHGKARRLELEEDDVAPFKQLVILGCGGVISWAGLDDLLDLGRVADRYQMDAIRCAVEGEIMCHLAPDNFGTLLIKCEGSGMRLVQEACRRMALAEFETFIKMEAFNFLEEDMLQSLLQDDFLQCEGEEHVLEAAVSWMKGSGRGDISVEQLLRTIRYPLMGTVYLATKARQLLPESEFLHCVVLESLALKKSMSAGKKRETPLRFLDQRMLQPRWRCGVRWAKYTEHEDSTRKMPTKLSPTEAVTSLADAGEFVYAGLWRGDIHLWSKASMQVARKLIGHNACVRTIMVLKEWVVSASDDSDIRVWNLKTGECVKVLKGHSGAVITLAVSGDFLLSGSMDMTVVQWDLSGAPSTWQCVGLFEGYPCPVFSLACSGNMLAVGCECGKLQVWDHAEIKLAHNLFGHTDAVRALAVYCRSLVSASRDQSIRVWSLDSGECIKVLQTFPESSRQYIARLAISGQKLVGGSSSREDVEGEQYEVRVWDLHTLAEEHCLKQPAGQKVSSLLGFGPEVWAGVGSHITVWGAADKREATQAADDEDSVALVDATLPIAGPMQGQGSLHVTTSDSALEEQPSVSTATRRRSLRSAVRAVRRDAGLKVRKPRHRAARKR